MRKLALMIMALSVALGAATGCSAPKGEDVAAEFDGLLQAEATAENVAAANDFLMANLSKLDHDQAAELLLALEEYALSYDNESVDYLELLGSYEGEIPDYLAELFRFKHIERLTPIISGAALQVSWPELIARTDAIEGYIEKYRDVALVKDDALWLYRRHLNAVLTGASNSPIFDYTTHHFSDEARAAYDAYVERRPDTVLTGVILEYGTYLDELGYEFLYAGDDSAGFFDICSRFVSEAEKRVYQNTSE
ncbi:MAG: hypothetical protein LBH39_04460 [Clostridiales Family XIII bacterium]|jgi:hypothetical protein|nr:hypothetical protein [Clostridiales Family XIII bacterium]